MDTSVRTTGPLNKSHFDVTITGPWSRSTATCTLVGSFGFTEPLNSTLTFSYNGFLNVKDSLKVLLELMVSVVLAWSRSLIKFKLVVFLTSAWMAPVVKSLTVDNLNSYCVSLYSYGTSVKVSPLRPRLRELTNGPFEAVLASNLITPEGNSLLKKSFAVLLKSPYLTTIFVLCVLVAYRGTVGLEVGGIDGGAHGL